MHSNKHLLVLAHELQVKKEAYTDAIAETFPVGSKVLVRSSYGWDRCVVTWTPTGQKGANPHVYVKREKTDKEHKINMSGIGGVGMIRNDFQ